MVNQAEALGKAQQDCMAPNIKLPFVSMGRLSLISQTAGEERDRKSVCTAKDEPARAFPCACHDRTSDGRLRLRAVTPSGLKMLYRYKRNKNTVPSIFADAATALKGTLQCFSTSSLFTDCMTYISKEDVQKKSFGLLILVWFCGVHA